MSVTPEQRSAKDCPFAWASKEALRVIGEHFAESNKVPSARSVYFALCELASNEQAERFQVKIATIARFAGVSTRTAHDVLPELELIKVVGIERKTIPGSKMDAPSIYTLFRVCNECTPLGNNCIPLCNGPEQTSVAENLKNLEKNHTEESGEEFPSPLPALRSAAGKKGRARKSKAVTTGAPADPRSALVTAGYCAAYHETFGTDYVHNGGRDGKCLKQFLAITSAEKFPVESIIRVAKAAMKRGQSDRFAKTCKRASSLQGLCDNFNEIRAELNGSIQADRTPNSTDPTPAKVAAWLSTVPEYASKSAEWTTWDNLPPFAREKFHQHHRKVITTP